VPRFAHDDEVVAWNDDGWVQLASRPRSSQPRDARSANVAASYGAAVLLTQIVRIPADGVDDFQQFESRVLPLLPRHGGALVRRVRGRDGQFEVHLVSFPSQDALDAYLTDPERVAALPLRESSGAKSELVEVIDVTT
jgi:uncharacterized protein (DUF1330 family)